MRLTAELKVPPGGFRGELKLAELNEISATAKRIGMEALRYE
jgi:hypothetical protein